MSLQLYLTGAVYSLDGSDSLKETMQTGIGAAATAADGVRVSKGTSPSRLPALTRSRVPPEPRQGGRVRPESRRDGRQDPRRRPGQGGAAGGGPRQAAAEQRSQGDPDGGQAAKRRQIIWTPFGLRGPFFPFF